MPFPKMSARQKLDEIKQLLLDSCRPLPEPLPTYVLFVTEGASTERAVVRCFTGDCFETLWGSLICQLANRVVQKKSGGGSFQGGSHFLWGIKFEVISECYTMSLERLKSSIAATKRNYFRFGVALNDDFTVSFTESEINANALFYLGADVVNGGWNKKNIIHYMNNKYKSSGYDLPKERDLVHTFVTTGVFLNDDNQIYHLHSKGVRSGRRVVNGDTGRDSGHSTDLIAPVSRHLKVGQSIISQMVKTATDYLCDQVNESGYMRYGYFPVFDRLIPGRNSLRQTCATLALIESYQAFKHPKHLKAARQSIHYLVVNQISFNEINGKITAYLTDSRGEIKLGGCGLLLLALVKYKAVTGSDQYDELMAQLASGLMYGFPRGDNGIPAHVLCSRTFKPIESFRTVYYEGEAMFGLASYYEHFKNNQVLVYLDNCFDALIAAKRWKSHDHWLAYACDKMYAITGDEKYVEMAISNVKGYLSFICQRETAFPTLLELCTATDRLAHRYGAARFYKKLDTTPEGFRFVTKTRALRLLDAYCWPETVMNFKAPEKVIGSFFIRHQAFRVRVDDVGHFILGLLAYETSLGKVRATIS